uniref:Uncharacterized protein LOC111117410 n=1 Tax=Crassostrea virginica TaxID=6565 RepID=A0A8B8C9C7_CRAVI|nr:uncharacterized protein LOC111117410 [Crassostrea virginica]XP_022312236.1 uncharacterized protein LOC111117410 [Crassostrea virginica]
MYVLEVRHVIIFSVFMYTTVVLGFENLALGQPVWEDRPWKGKENWTGENAVDGRYDNRSAMGGQCVVSENFKQTATWRVDLGGVVSISHIDIYYRTDNLPRPTSFTSRMAGFFLYISNTTCKDDAKLCFHEIQTLNTTPSEDKRINCSTHGRYVIYYNERKIGVTYPSYYSRFAYYELCELKVYGCPNSGYYGQNCSTPCPSNCLEKMCNINTGHCVSCSPGYHGLTCSQACKQQTYGFGCSSACGNCIHGESCHHVDGICVRGCREGWSGCQCKTKCHQGYYGKNCVKKCSVNCYVTRRCNRFTGQCEGGCKAGWTGNTCSQVSLNGLFTCGNSILTLTSIVVSAVTVFFGSVLNYICWRNNKIRMKDKRITDNELTEQQPGNEDSEYYTELQVSNAAYQYDVFEKLS